MRSARLANGCFQDTELHVRISSMEIELRRWMRFWRLYSQTLVQPFLGLARSHLSLALNTPTENFVRSRPASTLRNSTLILPLQNEQKPSSSSLFNHLSKICPFSLSIGPQTTDHIACSCQILSPGSPSRRLQGRADISLLQAVQRLLMATHT